MNKFMRWFVSAGEYCLWHGVRKELSHSGWSCPECWGRRHKACLPCGHPREFQKQDQHTFSYDTMRPPYCSICERELKAQAAKGRTA